MQIDSATNAAFEAINRSMRLLNDLNQTIVDQTQQFENKAVRMAVSEQVQAQSEAGIDLQA